jgi:predicted peroxiredoxin
MKAKIALVLFAGPEMPCKLQHALLFARDLAARGDAATIVFEGNAPQWLPLLAGEGHPQRRLFEAAKAEGLIGGVCRGCALAHNAVEAAEALGLPLLADAFGHVSLALLAQAGYAVVTL